MRGSQSHEKPSGIANFIRTSAEYEYDKYGNCTRMAQDFEDVSEFSNKSKGDHSKKQKNLSVKFHGGKIIINPAKGIDGLDAEIVISKIKS